MFGLSFTAIDWISWIVAIVVTIYVLFPRSPSGKGSIEYRGLWACRIALILLAWSFCFGMVGLGSAVASLILATIGIVKGRTLYGFMVIIGCLCVPPLNILGSFYSVKNVDIHIEHEVDKEKASWVELQEPEAERQKVYIQKTTIPAHRKKKESDEFVDTLEDHYWKLVSLFVEGKIQEASKVLDLFKTAGKLDYKDVKDLYKEIKIEELERKVRPIPASQALDNLRIYEQLLSMVPDKPRYKKKVAYYRKKVEEKKEKES